MSNISDKFKEEYRKYIKRDGAEEFLSYLESTDFFSAPASTRFHGAFEEGLCLHSLNVFMELIRLLKAYPEIKVSGETAAICALLHDVCKIGCYKISMRNVKENGQWVQKPYYEWDEDFCYGGHGSKSVYLIQKYMKLTDEEAVAINCHMGIYDRLHNDYGLAEAYKSYSFAWLLHVADESASYIRENDKREVQ